MMKARTHTYYMKDLDKTHPLKQFYKHANNLTQKHWAEYNCWKNEIYRCSDQYPTNIHIIFY